MKGHNNNGGRGGSMRAGARRQRMEVTRERSVLRRQGGCGGRELEAGLGRGRYVVGAVWDEGSMVQLQAIRRLGGRTMELRYGKG